MPSCTVQLVTTYYHLGLQFCHVTSQVHKKYLSQCNFLIIIMVVFSVQILKSSMPTAMQKTPQSGGGGGGGREGVAPT